MGFDSLADLPKWREPDQLIRTVRLVALTRPEVRIDWDALEAQLPGVRERVQLLDMPEIEIASRDLRDACRRPAGASATWSRTPSSDYIAEKGLYRQEQS